MAASRHGAIDTVRVLLAYRADLNQFGKDHRTALKWAQEGGYSAVVDMLKKAGAKE